MKSKGFFFFVALLSSAIAQAPEEEINSLISEIHALRQEANSYKKEEKSFNPDNLEEVDGGVFDFVIVGGGTSGYVAASRLAQLSDWKILLVEAGGEETNATKIPALRDVVARTGRNWKYPVKPTKYSCQGYLKQTCYITAGKMLGGTSSINGMWYQRGDKFNYNQWNRITPKWDWNSARHFYNYAEKNNFKWDDVNTCFGKNGPLSVENPSYERFPSGGFMNTCGELGMPRITKCGQFIGIGYQRLTSKKGVRQSTSTAYKLDGNKKNLKIVTDATVVKINLDETNSIALGIQYVKDDKLVTVAATAEVIMAAGTIGTPRLLLLSGIGPEDVLKEANIEPRVELPVGVKVKTHVELILNAFYDTKAVVIPEKNERELVKQYLQGKGPLTSPHDGHDWVASINIENMKNQGNYSDFILYGTKRDITMDINNKLYKNVYAPLEKVDTINFGILLTRTESEGNIKLKDNDPFHDPLLDLNILSDDKDVDNMVTAIMFLEKILELHSNRHFKMSLTLFQHKVPGCKNLKDKEYWGCVVRHLAKPQEGIIGGARMGQKDDGLSVVNQNLKVHKINNLRIVDASVLPVRFAGELTAVSVMIAEKAVSYIKNNYLKN